MIQCKFLPGQKKCFVGGREEREDGRKGGWKKGRMKEGTKGHCHVLKKVDRLLLDFSFLPTRAFFSFHATLSLCISEGVFRFSDQWGRFSL